MPLKKSSSPEAFTENLKAELKSGKPKKQALAIAYDVKRRSKARGGVVENILAQARPESPLKGIRVRTSKPNFLSRAKRPGGYAEGGAVSKGKSMAKKQKGFGFPASTKGAGRGEGLGALMPDVPPPMPTAMAPRPPMGGGIAAAPPPPMMASRRPKPVTALRGMAKGGVVKGDGAARKGHTKGRMV